MNGTGPVIFRLLLTGQRKLTDEESAKVAAHITVNPPRRLQSVHAPGGFYWDIMNEWDYLGHVDAIVAAVPSLAGHIIVTHGRVPYPQWKFQETVLAQLAAPGAPAVDWRAICAAYLRHVVDTEGATLLLRDSHPDQLGPDVRRLLEALADETLGYSE